MTMSTQHNPHVCGYCVCTLFQVLMRNGKCVERGSKLNGTKIAPVYYCLSRFWESGVWVLTFQYKVLFATMLPDMF